MPCSRCTIRVYNRGTITKRRLARLKLNRPTKLRDLAPRLLKLPPDAPTALRVGSRS